MRGLPRRSRTRSRRARPTAAVCALALSALCAPRPAAAQADTLAAPGRHRIAVQSTADGTLQPSWLQVPPRPPYRATRYPVLVLLHTWSNDLDQRFQTVEAESFARGWLLLQPNFRGRNDRPEACGSAAAQQDVLDALAWVKQRYAVDTSRVYLLGFSGGGFLSMLLAARHPEAWSAVSAWGGISDLTEWFRQHPGDDYGQMLRGCLSGSPLESQAAAAEARTRSPRTYLSPALAVPLDLVAGAADTVVSPLQTLRAFHAVAPRALGDAELRRVLGAATTSAGAEDPVLGRRILFRRAAGTARVTLFDGEHEMLAWAALIWLGEHRRIVAQPRR